MRCKPHRAATYAGRLPPDFDLARMPSRVSGLGLVRALLPRRSATLSLTDQDGQVETCVRLGPPSVRVDASATIPAAQGTMT